MSLDFRPNIIDVYEHYQLRVIGTRGEWVKAECPLPDHIDENPSATVNEELGKWKCWTCDQRGDALDIIAKRETHLVGFAQLVRFAEAQFGNGDSPVRGAPVRRGGLSVGAGSRRGGSTWQPPWRLS